MKKLISLLTAVLSLCGLLTGLSSCSEKESGTEGVRIVTTIFPTCDFARNIVGDQGTVTLLLKPGEESHSYEPTPQDILKIQQSDVFIYIGGESDTWIDAVLSSVKDSDTEIVTLMDCITPLEEEHSGENGEEHGHEYDEHIWTSPVNAIKMTERISKAIQSADPENAAVYKANTEKYLSELRSLDSEFRRIMNKSVRKTIIVGDRFPFLYFAKEYGLEWYAAFPGCSEESEVSAATVAALVNKVKTENIPVVFQIEMSNGKVADSICAETGAEKLLLHSCNNISKDEYEGGETYLSLMKKNADALKKALGVRDL